MIDIYQKTNPQHLQYFAVRTDHLPRHSVVVAAVVVVVVAAVG